MDGEPSSLPSPKSERADTPKSTTVQRPALDHHEDRRDSAVSYAPEPSLIEQPITATLTSSRTLTSPQMSADLRSNSSGQLTCPYPSCANLTFTRPFEYKKHHQRHTRPFHCTHPSCTTPQKQRSSLSTGTPSTNTTTSISTPSTDTPKPPPPSTDLPTASDHLKAPRTFTYLGGLLRHEREVHGKYGGVGRLWYCPVGSCKRSERREQGGQMGRAGHGTGKPFKRRDNMREHVRRMHGAVVDVDVHSGVDWRVDGRVPVDGGVDWDREVDRDGTSDMNGAVAVKDEMSEAALLPEEDVAAKASAQSATEERPRTPQSESRDEPRIRRETTEQRSSQSVPQNIDAPPPPPHQVPITLKRKRSTFGPTSSSLTLRQPDRVKVARHTDYEAQQQWDDDAQPTHGDEETHHQESSLKRPRYTGDDDRTDHGIEIKRLRLSNTEKDEEIHRLRQRIGRLEGAVRALTAPFARVDREERGGGDLRSDSCSEW